ncbi:MAG: hypothetical protein OXG19_04955 [Chloroflexi bacterium]|nr:hypothetical protein [Chloroflexota bacterium]
MIEEPFLTNRELASLILLSALIVFVLASSGRAAALRSVGVVLLTLATPKLLVPTVLYVVALLGALILACHVGLWEPALWKITVVWLVVAGLRLLFSLNQAIANPDFFRQALLRTVTAAAVVEFIVGLESFALWAEILGQGVAFIAVVTTGVAKQPVLRRTAHVYLGLLGLLALAWSTWHLIGNWSEIDHGMLVKELLVPIWLTPLALFLVYIYAVWAAYESAFVRMRIATSDQSLAGKRLALVLRTNIWLPHLRVIGGHGAFRIARAEGFREAWAVAGQILKEDRERAEAEAAAKRRLVDNAGRVGVDEFGRQLDQREFVETQASLRDLAISQMGHYRNAGGKYRADLIEILEPVFARKGLQQPSRISMYVASDGQSWYGERQTITGHWFAIGAAGPPSDQWLFDGPARPSGFPDEAEWDHWGGGEHSVNWD